MRTIQLTKGKETVIDDSDFEDVSRFKWHTDSRGYAIRRPTVARKTQIVVPMHRYILKLDPKDPAVVDHIDGNPLNNQRSNLRICTRQQNSCNQRLSSKNTSGFKGVSWEKRSGKWQVNIMSNGKGRHLGYFETPELAHEFYCLAADMLHGDFANHGAHIVKRRLAGGA